LSDWRRYVPPKRRLIFNGIHGVISQKKVVFTCSVIVLVCYFNIYGKNVGVTNYKNRRKDIAYTVSNTIGLDCCPAGSEYRTIIKFFRSLKPVSRVWAPVACTYTFLRISPM
jgi:hypothetical protein